ncbi:hypothetical protein BGZ96_005432 [Linnemannia gamsii]|uniref:Uncharacterized protein n=1 Tax=Linnemannia gamsii TaxID=64522 RepID=A0ABQ7K6R4_9FUNG|nr:hypothetical protein BGZ96_005432 [Linnemannia gamsii]
MTQSNITSATANAIADNAAEPTTTTTNTYNDISTTPASHISSARSSSGHSSSQNLDNQASSNFSAFASAHSYMMSPAINNATSIDLDKVRQMLSQVQIDNMPQGAKDLMRTMEMQSIALQQQKASSYLKLALLEERIMTKIEQRFQEMEDRILNKLLLATQQPNA